MCILRNHKLRCRLHNSVNGSNSGPFWWFIPQCYSNNITGFTFRLPCIAIDFFLNNQQDALIIQNLFGYKTLHVSDIIFAHHQEFPTVHPELVSFMQVLMTASKHSQNGTAFHPESAWIISASGWLFKKK